MRKFFEKKRVESPKIVETDRPISTIEEETEGATQEASGFFKSNRKSNQPDSTDDHNEIKRTGFFNRLKTRLSKTSKVFSSGIDKIFEGKSALDEDLLDELEELLITSDIGVQTSMDLIEHLSNHSSKISNADQLKSLLKEKIITLLKIPSENASKVEPINKPHIIMVVGVNGVGKTTTIGKMAAKAVEGGKSVLIAAADTFRAAAIDQLSIWADRAGASIVKHKDNADPAAVVYDGIEAAIARNVDMVLIDTAGRLHTKVNLMEELKKITRTVSRKIPDAPHEILLVLDATTGQNAISQAKLFDEALSLTGIVLAKLDGTAKGGIVVSICQTLNIPLKHIGIGEKIDDLQDFDPEYFAQALFDDSQPMKET